MIDPVHLAYGYAFVVTMLAFVGAGHLWKPYFCKICLVASLISTALGIVFEISKFFDQPPGVTAAIMSFPLFFLVHFQLIRWLFKKWKGTEPYLTDAASVVGGIPLDLFESAGKDGSKRKLDKNRRIMAADFLFSFVHVLVPVFTLLFLITFFYGRC